MNPFRLAGLPMKMIYSTKGFFALLLFSIFVAVPLPVFSAPVLVDEGTLPTCGNTGRYPSMLMIDGRQVISYYNYSSGNLMFARNTVQPPVVSWRVFTLDAAGDAGKYPSLVVVNGNPAI
jgi:hypothetical protein